MKFSELKSELDKGTVRNLYVFTGPEKAVMQKYIKKISENATKSSSFDEIVPRLKSKGLFATTATYVIEDDKAVTDKDPSELLSLIGKNTVILVFKDVDNRKKLFKKAKDITVQFEKFTENELIWFVKKELDVPDKLASLIAQYSGNDVARIENEVNKLAMLEEEITVDLVKELVHPPVEDRIFDMVDLVAKKQHDGVFKMYYDLVELKISPIQIIGLLYSKFKQVFLVQCYFDLQNAVLAGKTGLNFYQVNSARDLVGSFSIEELLLIMKKIQKVEVGIKTGKIDQNVAMEWTLIDILS